MRISANLLPWEIRRIIIEKAKQANIGHIGSALSVADIISALYFNVIDTQTLLSNDRDRVILSNGHTALALYATLFAKGILSEEEIDSFCKDGSLLGVHPDYRIKGVDFSTGSLGHGLSIGAGCALAAKLQKSTRRVFVVLSDAECNEGSIWEAVMFAAQNQLSNLVAIIDLNGQQALGYTEDILNLSPMVEKWDTFHWDCHVIDGNDFSQISNTLNSLDYRSNQPHVVIAQTTFGKGISFMEKQIKWHYFPMNEDEFRKAMAEIQGQITSN